MTEEEAKKQWCPFARVVLDWSVLAGGQTVIGPFNSDCADKNETFESDARTLCIASACMAWRWWGGTKKAEGYCGLAGKP